MVYFQDVSKSFGENKVVSHFSLELPESGAVCLFGPSGCGKTTLIHLLMGLVKPDSGRIGGLENKQISVVFQEDRLLPWATARENAAIAGGKKGAEWLTKLGLEDEALDQLPSELSGGMQRRVALARCLGYGGDIFLLDEPFIGLDAANKAKAMALIQAELRQKLMIFITHDREEALAMSDRIHVLDGPPVRVVRTIQNTHDSQAEKLLRGGQESDGEV